MKHAVVFIICSLLMALVACNSTPKQQEKTVGENTVLNDSVQLSTIQFEHTDFDFGKVTEGEIVEHTYLFTNTGEHDVLLREVKPSCGCTTPNFTKTAIKPGEQGKITVKFDSKGRVGNQNKQISVVANTKPSLTILRFTAQVRENK